MPILDALVLLPLMLPPTVVGYYLLVALAPGTPVGRAFAAAFGQDLVFTWQGAVLAAAVGSFPLLVRQAQTAFAGVPRELEEMAWLEGATRRQAFLTIVLPVAAPGVLAGIALGFARSLGDFGATLMVAGNIPGRTQTMSLAVYDAMTSGDAARAGILSLSLAAIGLGFAVAVSYLARNAPQN
jgi:molybdate transport system permease protein